MKPPVLTVLAHPDDESFGPAGLIMHYASQGRPCHLLIATDGAHSRRYRHEPDIKARRAELAEACDIIGYTSTITLHFEDGTLCNNQYHALADSIGTELDRLRPETVVTFDPRGISGHIDHIVVTSVVDYLFAKKEYLKEILYLTIPAELQEDNYFVYMPPGITRDKVDHIEDITDVWERKRKAILCHKSQTSDASEHLRKLEMFPKEEWYTIRRK
ncbi:MAG: PIG-L family deacetylase [Patescibacteria group bacterium]|nr:PIG-L family deacetylase [Patescibacteria group bacterium]